MFEYVDYLSDKKDLIQRMTIVREHFTKLREFDIDVSSAIDKIDSTINSIQNDEFSIVLVGAFSDGKTSVVAGWLNEEFDNMKIDSDESSNEILKYKPESLPDGCQIVDTPGLFGNKIGSDENGNPIVLSDITRKYISEANVILYVVTAKNPVKDSHKACMRWILNDLNKLSSTIFVINRMDDVVDLTDDEEYEIQKRIKEDTLRSKLVECGVVQKNIESVKVVCVSAAPDGKGIDVWKNHRDEYLRRSRLTLLEDAANEVIKSSREALIAKTGCDVLNDELNKALQEISRQEKGIDEIVLPEKKESLKRNKKDLESLKRRIKQSRDDIKDELRKLNKSKVSKIRSASMETFNDVIEDEIGVIPEKEGAVISEDISTIYNRYVDIYSGWTFDVGEKFQVEYEKQHSTIENLLKMGVGGVAKSLNGAGKVGVDSLKKAIFVGRDLLNKIGIVKKFRPWEVTKIARFAQKAMPIIGTAIDVVSNVAENISTEVNIKKFEKKKTELKNAINEVFMECIDQLKDDKWFFENFAPEVNILEEQIALDEQEIKYMEETKNKYMAWSKEVKDIECRVI